MLFLTTVASTILAQTEGGSAAPGAAPGGPLGGILQFAPFILMFAVIYFLLIRPANKQRKEHQALLGALKKDDEVVTSGGIVGRIVTIDDKIAMIEVADKVKIRIMRDRIAGRFGTATQPQTQQQK